MRTASPFARLVTGTLLGVVASTILVLVLGLFRGQPRTQHTLVPEDASGHLRRIAIHYVPGMDNRVMPVWRQLFRYLPDDVEVEVAVERARDFERLVHQMQRDGLSVARFKPVVVGHTITTWSRDRMAAIDNDAVISPPKISTGSGPRAGDWQVPFAIARDVYDSKPELAGLVFEGGDLAASKYHLFADANLIGRNAGRGEATREHLEGVLRSTFSQDVVWLGNLPGDVPEHHIMMYMMPLDEEWVLVGDVRGAQEAAPVDFAKLADPDVEGYAARFDRVADELTAKGFKVLRIPVIVLPGGGSYVTYTNAVFDRDVFGPIVYLPTYGVPALDEIATNIYAGSGYRVIPIDVSTMYTMNGSLGCLVNVMARE